eukprot:CAMPEP_0178435922 /NCGR_PEP_ID=MMETSP0689_2-20121128/34176_1 /TAXON_ID=160604 /ORGANISM="Amphidinium massartii, Strain CS-259" /LENGTH=261 /DNA_ID=CAMNT_0020058007 /DNA_START=79 /DNA_END=864 /DNA_ORIENTATION=-
MITAQVPSAQGRTTPVTSQPLAPSSSTGSVFAISARRVAMAVAVAAAPLVATKQQRRSRCTRKAIQEPERQPMAPEVSTPARVVALPMNVAMKAHEHPFFDPLGLARDDHTFRHGRSMEIVLGRFAMIAAVGIPMAEMHHEALAEALNFPVMLADGRRAPSILNGGPMTPAAEVLTVAALCAFGYIVSDIMSGKNKDTVVAPGYMAQPGLSPVVASVLREAEVHNGRFAMMGVVLIGMMEAVSGKGVIELTPELFGLPRTM